MSADPSTASGGWHVPRAAAATPLLALALLAVSIGALEITARAAFVRTHLPPPSVGSPSRPLELQLAALQALADTEGDMDCIFLGNSLVLFGLDPDAFAAAYEKATGRPIRCFNFAVPGITVSGIVALSRVLAADYHPWLIVYGIAARDFSTGVDAPAIEQTQWLQYRQGNFNIEGWVADHSYAYRYYLLFAHGTPILEPALRHFHAKARRGFYPFTMTSVYDNAAKLRARNIAASTFRLGADHRQVEALDTFFALPARGTQIALVEMPWHLAASQWTADTAANYHALMNEVQQRTQRTGTPYWETMSSTIAPEDGWVDLWHLNEHGADVVSRWLGERVAEAVHSGTLQPPAAPARPSS